jgi:hypothetical protein
MLPKDLTAAVAEKLKKTAETYPAGAVPQNFDPNNFVFRSNTGLTIMITLDNRSDKPYWLLSMSYPSRVPREDEAREVLALFFGEQAQEAGKVLMPEGSNPNIAYYRLSATLS